MNTIKDFFSLKLPTDKPWLVLGKGPSFSTEKANSCRDTYLFTLNHAELTCIGDIWHIIDWNVFNSYKFDIINIDKLVIPYYPHFNNIPKIYSIYDLQAIDERIQFLIKKRKLYCYNLSTTKAVYNNSPVVKCRFFSSEAAFRLLGMQGIKEIYSLGIDGGSKYAKEFKHLKPLTNGRVSFDVQFPELEKICKEYDIKWTKL